MLHDMNVGGIECVIEEFLIRSERVICHINASLVESCAEKTFVTSCTNRVTEEGTERL